MKFTPADIENARFGVEIQFHLLRHFAKLDKPYVDGLLQTSNYTLAEIEEQLKVPGSKFNYSFTPNPIVLFNIIKNYLQEQETKCEWKDNRCEITIEFDTKQYPDGVGVDGIINIEQLIPEELKTLTSTLRFGKPIMVVEKEKVPAWTVNIILLKEREQTMIKSIFPGIYAPPLPDLHFQASEDYQRSLLFWNKHAFISEKATDNSWKKPL